jgi:predicted ATPase
MQRLKLVSRALSTTVPETTIPNLVHKYEALVSGGFLQADASQLRCLERLQILLLELHSYGGQLKEFEHERISYEVKRQVAEQQLREELERKKQQHDGNGGGWSLSQLFSYNSKEDYSDIQSNSSKKLEHRVFSLLGPPPAAPIAPRGVYFHGSVGSGKTMLLDMLYNASETIVLSRRRLHCNSALLELHSRMHTLERKNFDYLGGSSSSTVGVDDPLGKNAKVARIAHRRLVRDRMLTPLDEYTKGIAAANSSIMLKAARELLLSEDHHHTRNTSTKAALLCFDEMQTTDPYNVAALKALTETALQNGGTLVATSNRAPKELSPHGLHEAMFEHFVETLEGGCDVVELSSPTDYRRTRINLVKNSKKDATMKNYFWPLNADSAAQLEAAWNSLEGKEILHPIEIPVMFGRTFTVHKHRGGSGTASSAAWFSFDELCDRPLGPSDYIALASHFNTIFITDVPAMSMRVRDKARRFITLIDEVYNQRGRVVCTAAVELDQLFTGKEVNEEPLVDLEGLQFEGAVEGAKLRRDLSKEGGVAPVAVTAKRIGALGGEEERFAFARAVSRLYEMTIEVNYSSDASSVGK